MSRKVYITDDMGRDEALLAVLDENAQAAERWPWFITVFDDWGRASANARIVKGDVFALFEHVTVADVEAAIQLYAKHGLIRLYEVDGKRCMCVEPETWYRYQTHIHQEKRKLADTPQGSRYPAPPPRAPSTNRSTSAEVRENPRDSAEIHASPSTLHLPPSTLTSPSPSPSHPPPSATGEAPAAPGAPSERPGAALVLVTPAPKPAKGEHPFGDLWDAFDRVLGEVSAPTEKTRRAKACKELREGHYTAADLLAAAEAWPNVMADASMGEMGLVANMGKLLRGPQRNGRNAGLVQQHRQQLSETAVITHRPSVSDLRRQRHAG